MSTRRPDAGKAPAPGRAQVSAREARDRGTERSTRVIVALVILSVIAYAGLLAVSREFTEPHQAGSTYDESPLGLKVFFAYLTELGYEPETLERWDTLPDPDASTIVVSEPILRAPTGPERQALADWVRAGGRLVLLGDVQGIALELDVEGAGSSGQRRPVAPDFPSVYAQGVERIDLDGERLQVADTSWVALYKDLSGQALLSRAQGMGEVLWLATPYPASNAGIASEDNARFMLGLALQNDRDVFFDEYHHGYIRGGGLWERAGNGGRAAAVLALVALGLLLMGPVRRLGRPIPTPYVSEARTGSYTTALAELYRRAGARREALETLEEGLKRVVARRHGTLRTGLERYPAAIAALEGSAAVRSRPEIDGTAFIEAAGALGRARREVEGRDE